MLKGNRKVNKTKLFRQHYQHVLLLVNISCYARKMHYKLLILKKKLIGIFQGKNSYFQIRRE